MPHRANVSKITLLAMAILFGVHPLAAASVAPITSGPYPVISDGSLRYDVMGSNDLADWQCLRVTTVDVEASDKLSDLSLPEGFEWRVVETKWSLENLTGATFPRIRVSE